MLDQAALKVALQHLGSERQEIEAVGVFENLLREFRLPGRQSPGEIRKGATLAGEQVTLDLMDEDVTAPTVLDSLASVPGPLRRGLYGVKQADVMAPGQ